MQTNLPKFLTDPNPEVYLSGNYVVLDFETTTLDKGSALNAGNSIVLAVWRLGSEHPDRSSSDSGLRRGGYYVKRSGEYDLAGLVRHIERASFLVAHNAKFELQWLERCGLDLREILVYDTQIGEYVLGGNRYSPNQLALDRIAKRRWKGGKDSVVSKMIKDGCPVEDIPESWLEKYCVRDVELTERLFLAQRGELHERQQLPIMYNRCLLTPVLADIEKNGMKLDPEVIRITYEETEREWAKQAIALEKVTGGINLNSPKQVGEYLYDKLGFEEKVKKVRGKWVPDRTDKGGRRTDADTIAGLKATTPEQEEFQREYAKYRELYSQLTKYLRKFDACCRDAGGLLQASFNQTNTRTHRLSSTGTTYSTQFQNLPRAYKPFFEARTDGWLMGECDGAQLEFRVAAHLGRDAVALRDIEDGTDVHSVTAGIIGVGRTEAKAHTFKPLYGGTSGTPAEQEYYGYFRERYYGITETQQGWIDEVLERKFLTTEWGMRYYWPDCQVEAGGYVRHSTAICNYPVQAFATAEIIPIALVFFWHRLKRSNLRMFLVNTVHDSIIAELPPEEKEAFHELAKTTLIDDVYYFLPRLYGIKLTVPLGCGVKIAKHWSGKDGDEEVVYEAEKRLYS